MISLSTSSIFSSTLEEQKKKIRQDWDAADTAGRETLKKTYGAENVKVALEDAQSEEWIGKNTKPCPKCATPIEVCRGNFSDQSIDWSMTNWLIHWLIHDQLIDWLIDWMIEWSIEWLIDWMIDWLIG